MLNQKVLVLFGAISPDAQLWIVAKLVELVEHFPAASFPAERHH